MTIYEKKEVVAIPKSDDFLIRFSSDCQKAMRTRMQTEYKLLRMFIILNPVIITAVLGINNLVGDRRTFIWIAFSMAAFLTVLTMLITLKIVAEHKIYEKIGGYVVNTWEYFDLFKDGAYIAGKTILDEDAKSYGKGSGYKKTIYILWAMMIMADVILAIFAVIK